MSLLRYFIPSLIVVLPLFTGCQNGTVKATQSDEQLIVKPFEFTSPAFHNCDTIPVIYTCDSSNISPELHWHNPVKKTASYAIIMEDPDAPGGTWIHWIVYNIPATDSMLTARIPRDSALTNGIKQGFTSFGAIGYGGPCPPGGTHRYYFKLYALDTDLKLKAGLTKTQLMNAMTNHILAETDLQGKYSHKKKDQ